MGHKAAGGLDSIFWVSITVGRLGFIFMSYRFTAPTLLTLSLVWTFEEVWLLKYHRDSEQSSSSACTSGFYPEEVHV